MRQLDLDHHQSMRQGSAMPVELKVGDLAPEFRGQAIGGKYGDGLIVSLGDFRGLTVVLYLMKEACCRGLHPMLALRSEKRAF